MSNPSRGLLLSAFCLGSLSQLIFLSLRSSLSCPSCSSAPGPQVQQAQKPNMPSTLDNQGTACLFFWPSITAGEIEVGNLCGVETWTPHKGGDRIAHGSVYGKSLTGQVHGTPITKCGGGHTGK